MIRPIRHIFMASSLLISANTYALEDSILLDDTIKKGYGVINLFDPQGNASLLTAAQLEEFRVDNADALVLGVDINEAARGSEKASTQGVTIKGLNLVVMIDGQEYIYSDHSTKSKTLVAEDNSSTRQEYYTLLGRSGSNSITGSSLDGTSFDSTLRIPVDQDLTQATSVLLYIEFVSTNITLGDPEAFYDYNAGFEDLGLLTASDASFLDEQAAGFDGAPMVIRVEDEASKTVEEATTTISYPASNSYYLVGYEDLYPNTGDYDFNDAIVAYRIDYKINTAQELVSIQGEGVLVARGSSYNHDWHLRIPFDKSIQGSGSLNVYKPDYSDQGEMVHAEDITIDDNTLDISPFQSTRDIFQDPYEGAFANTLWDSVKVKGQKFVFNIDIESTDLSLSDLSADDFDPYLFVIDSSYEIHLPNKPPVMGDDSLNVSQGHTDFINEQGYPFAMLFPESWDFPNEYIDLGVAYPDFYNFMVYGEKDYGDWYLNRADTAITKFTQEQWRW